MKFVIPPLLIAFFPFVFATGVFPNISIAAHNVSDGASYLIHISNLSQNPIVLSRVELSIVENNIVEDYRYNILFDCSEDGDTRQITIDPWVTMDVTWDGKDNQCNDAKNGRYFLQLVDTCEYEGCTGSYHISAGGHFDIK